MDLLLGRPALERPNVIILYSDDQDFDEVGCYGGKVLTPHTDRLAAEGIRFTRAYISSSVCAPSRYTTLTGRYCSRNKSLLQKFPAGTPITFQQGTPLIDEDVTVAHVLKANGYATGMVGKWMLGSKAEGMAIPKGGDPEDPEIIDMLAKKYEVLRETIRKRGFDYVESVYLANIYASTLPKKLCHHNMEWVTHGALNFIEQNKENPFFLYYPTTIPHDPNPIDSMKSDPRTTPLGYREEHLGVQPSRESVMKRCEEAGIRVGIGFEYGVTWMDDSFGVILKKLEDLGIAENTLIIFASDHQSKGKQTCYDGARTPFIVKWKGVVEPAVSDRLICNVDIAPTIFEICGVTPPEGMTLDGVSFAPLLLGKNDTVRDSVYLEIAYTRAVVDDDNFKYIAWRMPLELMEMAKKKKLAHTGKTNARYRARKLYPHYQDYDQLYNLTVDPKEQRNLYKDPEYEEKVLALKQKLSEYCSRLPHSFGEFKKEE